VRAQYVGERYYGEEGLVESETVESWIDEYFLLHTNLSIPLMKKFQIHAGVNNITDVYDVVWGPMPGREWYIGIRFNQNSK
jgi:outer membrane receptor protein involved in Fe transport